MVLSVSEGASLKIAYCEPNARYWRASRSTVAAVRGVSRCRSRSLMAMKILSGSFSTALRVSPNSASSTSSASFQFTADLVSLPSYLPCG